MCKTGISFPFFCLRWDLLLIKFNEFINMYIKLKHNLSRDFKKQV